MSTPFYVKFNLPKELVDVAYEALQVARDTGKVMKGTNEATKAIERGIAKLVYIAEDVNPPEIVAHLPLLCEERNIAYLYVPDKNRLGVSSGISVNAASACIVEAGDAETLVQEISSRLKKIREGG
jgi:large subunit ribosomal protein L7Ae